MNRDGSGFNMVPHSRGTHIVDVSKQGQALEVNGRGAELRTRDLKTGRLQPLGEKYISDARFGQGAIFALGYDYHANIARQCIIWRIAKDARPLGFHLRTTASGFAVNQADSAVAVSFHDQTDPDVTDKIELYSPTGHKRRAFLFPVWAQLSDLRFESSDHSLIFTAYAQRKEIWRLNLDSGKFVPVFRLPDADVSSATESAGRLIFLIEGQSICELLSKGQVHEIASAGLGGH